MKKMCLSSPKCLASLAVFASVLVVYGICAFQREAGYRYWMEHKSEYVVDHVTAMSTLDSYYWLKMARDMDEGKLGKKQIDPLQGYPDGADYPESPSLLARLISLDRIFTGGDYYRAALLLVPILAGLFVFPLYLYFRHLGFGASAVLGGLIGSFSHAYYDRTVTGRVDTDLLNTFFPLAISSFILLINRERSLRANSGLAVGAGLSMYFFNWWYQQPGITFAYLIVMAVYLLLGRVPLRQIALLVLLFLLASGPGYVLQSLVSLRKFWFGYIAPPSMGRITWPDAMTFISEAQHKGFLETLKYVFGLLPVTYAGIAGLVYLGIRRFRQMIPVAPMIILGAWSLIGQVRFAMYLAPFIGIGIGVVIELLVKFVASKTTLRPQLVPVVSVALMFTLFFSTTAYTGYGYTIGPYLSASTTKAFLDLKSLLPKHSAIFTPLWDYGYPLMEIGGFATYHDGAMHGGLRTTLISRAVTSTKQSEMVSLLSYLQDNGFNKLNREIADNNLSADQMLKEVFDYKVKFRGEKVYVLYLENMIDKFGSISKYGTWNFATARSDPMRYHELSCFSVEDNIFTCRQEKIDLNRGLVITNNAREVPLKAVLFVNNGYVVEEKNYPAEEGFYMQILEKNGKAIKIQLVDDRLFWTNFNQQFLLGNYDRRYFEEVYNNFPVARVFKVKSGG